MRFLEKTSALARAGFAEAVAYRAERLIWVLSTTMPLVMLALFRAGAEEAPLGRLGKTEVTGYFLATFVVRQVTGSWAAWQINMEVRQGTMATRLLRPVHPVASYAMETLAALPVRAVMALPLGVVLLFVFAGRIVTRDPVLLGLLPLALLGGLGITFFVNVAIGALSFFADSTLKLVDLYLVCFFVLSGYLVPMEAFPSSARPILDLLPFRHQIGLPVEMLTGAHGRSEALRLLAIQWAWVTTLAAVALGLFRAGLRRFAAYGG